MSRIEGDTFVIEPEEPDTCTKCHKTAELRPYGENGARICYECGMKDLPMTEQQFGGLIAPIRVVVFEDSGPQDWQ